MNVPAINERIVMSGMDERVTNEVRDCTDYADGYCCVRKWLMSASYGM